MFCANCGKEVADTNNFCIYCGAPKKAAGMAAAPASNAPVTTAGIQNPEQKVYRVKCSHCGTVYDSGYTGTCPKCGTPHNIDLVNNGIIHLYRMGHFSGSMNGLAIYINGEGMGHVANTGSALIELAPGNYNLHCAIGMTRKCDDLKLTIEPGKTICVKSQLKMGAFTNQILLHVVDPSEMPPL